MVNSCWIGFLKNVFMIIYPPNTQFQILGFKFFSLDLNKRLSKSLQSLSEDGDGDWRFEVLVSD